MKNIKKRNATKAVSPVHSKEWTIMVYMSADNNLSSECVWALTEMQQSTFDQRIAVVAQFDPPGQGIGTKQYDFSSIGSAKPRIPLAKAKLEDFEVDDLGDDPQSRPLLSGAAKRKISRPIEQNFADSAVLEHFIGTAMKRYPAKHYLVVLSGFGNGPSEGILTDENPSGSMSIPALRAALDNIKDGFTEYLKAAPQGEIDILGFDSCLMSMVEVASELSGTVRYLVASEGTTPSTGWSYRKILEKMQPTDPETVALNILDNFLPYYSDYVISGVSVDQCICNLAHIKPLETALQGLVQALTDTLENEELTLKEQFVEQVVLAHWKAQGYRFEQHVDLWDFCSCLKDGLLEAEENAALRDACGAVMKAVAAVVVKSGFVGAAFQHSHGLSVYFPWAISQLPTIREYDNLVFSKRTKWGQFLVAYVKDTQRKMRGPKFENQLSVFPQDIFFYHRDNPRLNDVRDNPRLNDARDNPPIGDVRDNPPIGDVRDNPRLNDARDNPPIGDVRDLLVGSGVILLAPKVKNPPDHFYQDQGGKAPAKKPSVKSPKRAKK